MYAREEMERRDDRPTEDHVVFLRGVTWDDYERLLEIRGDCSAPRYNYLGGVLEIMCPSRSHEGIKSLVGCLVEAYCLENDIRFMPLGSWTLKERKKESGAEPDECYVFGGVDTNRPHLAIEVVWTSGRIDKLEIYRRLGVKEVWWWSAGRLQPYLLRDDHFEEVDRSECLPGLDLELLTGFLDRPTAYDAIKDYREALRARRSAPREG